MSLPSLFLRPQETLSNVLPGAMTPFTWSVFGPAADRLARAFFAELGYQFPAEQAIWQRHNGQVTLNTAALAEAEQAILAVTAATATSFGDKLFGGGLNRQAQTMIHHVLDATPTQFAAVQRWRTRVQAMQWRQATVLQIMEEIEPQAEAALAGQTALLALALSTAQLAAWLARAAGAAAADLAPRLCSGADANPASAAYRRALWTLEQAARADGPAADRLQQGDWQNPLPTGAFREAFDQFLQRYGSWAESELEAASPRWSEEPTRLLAAVAARLNQPAAPAPPDPATLEQQRRAAAANVAQQLGMLRRRHFEPAFANLQRLFSLAVEGREAAVTVVATARAWALGAAQEIVADGRLAAVDDVFFLELEELKQIITGEWSSPEQVLPLVAARRGR